MALPTVVGTGTPVLVSSGNMSNVPYPAGYSPVAGDIAEIHVSQKDNVVGAVTGYTEKAATNWATNQRTAMYYKRLVGGEGTPTVTRAGGSTGIAWMIVYRGCKATGDPYNFFSPADTDGSPHSTQLAPTVDDCLLGLHVYNSDDAAIPSGATGGGLTWTDRVSVGTSLGQDASLYVATAPYAGSHTAFTVSWTDGNAQNIAYVYALEPDAGAGSTPISSSDSGTATDTASLSASQASTQAASGADQASIAATGSSSDSGSGTDTPTLHPSISNSDAGTSTDAGSPEVALIPSTQTGTFSENASADASVASTQNGSFSDTPSLAAQVSSADSGSGNDAITLLAAVLAVADIGTGLDSGSIGIGAMHISDTDGGIGSEGSSIVAAFTSNQVAAGTDGQTIIFTFPVFTDFGVGTDTAVAAVPVSDADTGALVDNGVLRALLPSEELGVGLDTLLSLSAVLASLQEATGLETQSIVSQLADVDFGTAIEIGRAIFGIFIGAGAKTYLLAADIETGDVTVTAIQPGLISVDSLDSGNIKSGGID